MSATNYPSEATPVRSDNASESTAEIRAEIETTRSSMGTTLDAIQEKLNPDTIKGHVTEAIHEQVETVREHVAEAVHEQIEQVREHVAEAVHDQIETVKGNVREATIGRVEHMVNSFTGPSYDGGHSDNSIIETIKQNPVPAALMGIGLAMLLRNRNTTGGQGTSGSYGSYNAGGGYRGGNYGYNSPNEHRQPPSVHVGEAADAAKEKLGDVADAAKDKASQFADQAGDLKDRAQSNVSQFGDQAQQQVGQAKSWLDQNMRDNPMSVGALALVAGLAVGMTLPSTPVENRMLGETRDNLVGQVQAKAQDTMQKVSNIAQEVGDTVKETAKQEAQKQGLMQ